MVFQQLSQQINANHKKIIAMTVFFIFILLIIKQPLQLFWFESGSTSVKTIVHVKKTPQINLNSALFNQSLFGDYVSDTDNIKRSTLDLHLVGLLYSPTRGSQVIIRLANGEEHIYAEGDKIPGDVILKKINTDHAVILYDGALQRLNLMDVELKFSPPIMPLNKE